MKVVDRVKAGQSNEDFRVELKSDWIDPYKAARRIAGQGNAARGEQILFVIPNHRCTGWFEIPEILPKTSLSSFQIKPYVNNNRHGLWNPVDLYSEQMNHGTPDELIVNGCGMIQIKA